MDKYFDKLFDNPWFIRIIALILALLLFQNVYDENNAFEENVPQEQETETIEDVPVKSIYDTENLVVSGVPETVNITLTGPKNILQQAMTQRGYEVYVDLTDAEIGNQRVPIEIRDISERLDVKIEPEFVNVSVQEKVTQEFNVEAEFNNGMLADGYISEQAVIKPSKVKITGAKDIIGKIAYVKATFDVNAPIKETLTREAEVLALDKNLNKLNVTVEPGTVNITIPVTASSKKVPINIVQTGSLPEGITIESVTPEENEATIIGNKEVLEDTESVRVELDVSNIEEDTVVTLPVIIPEGIVEVNPETIKLTVTVSETDNKTLSNIPIKIEGLSDQYNATFREPPNGEISLTVSGSTDEINALNTSHFDVFIDVSNLSGGEHDVAINVNGPENINWNLGRSTARISITQKEV